MGLERDCSSYTYASQPSIPCVCDADVCLSAGKPSGGDAGFGPSSEVAKEEADGEEGEEEEECGVCKEPIEDLVRAECGCAFCRSRPSLPIDSAVPSSFD